jgi:hypothetical protein
MWKALSGWQHIAGKKNVLSSCGKNRSIGVNKISEFGLRIADFEGTTLLMFQSAIRNLKSAIDMLQCVLKFKLREIIWRF